MIVTRILGDCPGCRGKNCFGNVLVRGNRVFRGCMSCKFSTFVLLPEIRKKIIYLDQFFFSGAFRGGDERFVRAAQRIQQHSAHQLLVAPFSSVHEDEAHQWRGYADLMKFIKNTSGGHKLAPDYEVERTQIDRAFKGFLAGSPPVFMLQERDAIHSNVHEWDDYYRIDAGRYIGDIESIRELKRKTIEELVDIFDDWQQSTNTFDQDVALEIQAVGKEYVRYYIVFASRVASGDHEALIDSPVISMVVESMMQLLPEGTPLDERFKQIARFFASEHFAQVPYHWLSVRMFAMLKDMVKRGAYTKRESALGRLSGFFYDVRHIAMYAPYCDAFVMDQPMAALVADPKVGLGQRYGVRVFSLNNWDDLFAWLDTIEAEITDEHRAGLSAAYPCGNSGECQV